MADDESSMDLNLYVGLPSLTRPRNLDLNLDLTLSSATFQGNHSPSNALLAPESMPVDPLRAADDIPALEPSLRAGLVEQGAHPSDAPNSAPHAAPTSAGPDQPSASHPPAGRIPQRHDEAAASVNPCPTLRMIDVTSRSDSSGSRHGLLECPQLRFQRLIESNNRIRGGSSDRRTSPTQLMHDIMQSQKNLEAFRRDNLHGKGKGTACLGKEKQDKAAADFACNICLDLAKEPVVTPCGHLFCWPCLYQWLHASPASPECPVCKGEVSQTDLMPIFGQGRPDTGSNAVPGEDGNSALKIPPRPHAHRTESLTQKIQRSMTRILAGERHTIRRRIEDLQFGEDMGPSSLNASDHAAVRRLNPQDTRREGTSGSNITGYRLPTVTVPNPVTIFANFLTGAGRDRHPSTDMLHAGLTRRSAPRCLLLPVNFHRHEPPHHTSIVPSIPTAEQASTSSTAALTTGNGTAGNISEEPNREWSSRILGRRGRSSNPGSLDEEEGAAHLRRSRRLN